MTRTNEKGFTLVEVIVTAVLLSLLVAAGYAFFFVFTKEKVETAAYLKAQVQSEAFMDALGRYTRSANYLSPYFEKNADLGIYGQLQRFKDSTIEKLSRDSVFFHRFGVTSGENASQFAGFRVKDTNIGGAGYRYLQELDSAKSFGQNSPVWKNFMTGIGDVVLLPPNLKANASSGGSDKNRYGKVFYMPSGKLLTALECNMTIRTINNKDTFDLKLERGRFQCRR